MDFIILIIGLLASACSFENSNALYEKGGTLSSSNNCSDDAPCQNGESCSRGMCVTRSVQPVTVSLEVAPVYGNVNETNKSDLDASSENQQTGKIEPAVSVIAPFVVSGVEAKRTFDIPPLVEVSGKIRYTDTRVPATISFIPSQKTEEANTSRTITTTTTDQSIGDTTDTTSDYITYILQNVNYDVIVQPINDPATVPVLPPFISRGFRATDPTGAAFDVAYTPNDIRSSYFPIALPDIQSDLSLNVFAVSSDDPNITVSSSSTINRETRGFSLYFFSKIDPYNLIIAPNENTVDAPTQANNVETGSSQKPVWPVFTIRSVDLETAIKSPPNVIVDKNGIQFLKIPSVQQPVVFSGRVDLCGTRSADAGASKQSDSAFASSDTSLPISFYSTKLLFDDDQTAIRGSYNTHTNAEYDAGTGELSFSVNLFPGEYDVVITPPSNSACEILARKITINTDNNAATQFQLFPITYLEGMLKTANGEPLFGAIIQAQALGRDGIDTSDNSAITRYNRSSQTTTDENGGFRLPVDLGSYDIVAKPPSASRFGWQVITDVKIGTRDTQHTCDIVLEAPIPIEGVLSYRGETTDTTPPTGLEGAGVSVFSLIDDIGAAAGVKRKIAIGRATADDQRSFTALISPSIRYGL
jgi:hypothetical protein